MLTTLIWGNALRKVVTSICAAIIGLGGATKAWSEMDWPTPVFNHGMHSYIDKRIDELHLAQLQRQVIDSQIDNANGKLDALDNATVQLQVERAKPTTDDNVKAIIDLQIRKNGRAADAIQQQLQTLRNLK